MNANQSSPRNSDCPKCKGYGWILKGNGNDEECDCIFVDPPESAPPPDASLPQTPRTDAATFDLQIYGDAYRERINYPDGMGDFVEADFARSLERDLATLKAERDEAREKLRKALATLKRIGSNQSRYYGSEAMNMYRELTK